MQTTQLKLLVGPHRNAIQQGSLSTFLSHSQREPAGLPGLARGGAELKTVLGASVPLHNPSHVESEKSSAEASGRMCIATTKTGTKKTLQQEDGPPNKSSQAG